MPIRVKIRDLKVQWLNAMCLNIIAKYAREAFIHDGTKIRMSSDTCLIDVVDHVADTTNPTLKSLYRELKQELRKVLSADHLQPKLDALEKYQSQTQYNIDDMSV